MRRTASEHTTRLHPGQEALAADAVSLLTMVAERDGHTPTVQHLARVLRNPDAFLIVHAEDGTPVGYLLAFRFDRIDRDASMIYLYDIMVDPPRRRRGIGRRMIEHLKGLVRDTDGVEIWVGTSLDNEAARALYRSTGAREISERYVEFLYPRGSFA